MKKIFLILTTLTLLGACSFKALGINNLEHIVSYRLGNQLGLYFSQKSELTEQLREWLLSREQKKHTKELMVFLEDLNWKEQDLHKAYDFLNQRYQKIALNFNHILAKNLAKLNSEQQAEFFLNMKKGNKKLENEESAKKSVQRMINLLFGDMTQEQEELFNTTYTKDSTPPRSRLRRRMTSQKKIREIFELNLSEDKRVAPIKNALDHSTQITASNKRVEQNINFLNSYRETLTGKQIEHFQDRKQEALESSCDFSTIGNRAF